MADNSGGKSDRNLLDRLNALKAASAGQGFAPKPIVPQTLPLGDPRQDVLSDRLRALRNQSPGGRPPPASPSVTSVLLSGRPTGPSMAAAVAPPAPTASASRTELEGEKDADGDSEPDVGEFDVADDMALEDFLEDLELDLDDGGDGEAQHLPSLGTANDGKGSSIPEDDAKRIAAVLARLEMNISALPPTNLAGNLTGKRFDKDGVSAEGGDGGGGGGDDSGDEEGNVEVENIVSRAFDETKLDSEQETSGRKGPLSLPAVPDSLLGPKTQTGKSSQATGNDFESAISRRLAALRGLGGSGGDDGIALPSAPSFQPASKKPTGGRSKVQSTGGYTDEDQQGWCIVCLEDATSICVGCDGDAYCEACWRDMHVGPVASFDASHKRMAFVKDRKKKRMLVAA